MAREFLNNFTNDEFELYINATMNPDKQLGKIKDVPDGTIIEVTHIAQEEIEPNRGGNAVATTLVGADGTSYQTLSNFVDRFFMNAARVSKPDTWREHPIKIQVEWKDGKQNPWLSIKLVK